MTAGLLTQVTPAARPRWGDPAGWLGVLLGIVMPVVAGLAYPTYRHILESPGLNNSMLLEAPFVLCELLVVIWAIQRGLDLRAVLGGLPRDCRAALLILMIGVWASALFVSKALAMSVMISLSTVTHLLFVVAIAHLLREAAASAIGRFAAGLAAGLVVLTAWTAWRFLLPPPLSELPGHVIEWGFALPGFINVRYFGTWTGAIGTLFAAMILNRRDGAGVRWHELAFFGAALLTIWSGTRSAVLGMTLACAIMLISQRRLPDLRVLGSLATMTVAALAINQWLLPHPDPSFLLFHGVPVGGNADTFTSGRAELWQRSYEKWLEAPWFGWGSGSTFWEVHVGWTHTQPHNFVLQFLISWGIVGACGALWLLSRATVAAQRRALADPRLWPLNTALYALLIMATLDGALHYPRFIMLIMALYAMVFRLGGGREAADRPWRLRRRSRAPRARSDHAR